MYLARYPNVNANNGTWQWTHVASSGNATTFTYGSDVPVTAFVDEVPSGAVWMHGTYLGQSLEKQSGPHSTRFRLSRPITQGYWQYDWSDNFVQLAAINPGTSTIVMGTGAVAAQAKGRYIVFNALGLLDAPGEYYINRTSGELYFWPPAPPGTDDEGGAFLSGSPHVFAGSANYFTLANLTLLHARGTAVIFDNSTGVQVLSCRVANHGANGTMLIGDDHVIADNEVTGVGCMGVGILGGNRTTLTGGQGQIRSNTIHHYARWKRTYQAGIFWAGVGHVVDGNSISFAPHNAVLGGGNEDDDRGGNNCVFSNNVVNYTTTETSDSGAFYTCGQVCRGQRTERRSGSVKKYRPPFFSLQGRPSLD